MKKITKRAARAAFEAGRVIFLQPSRTSIYSEWVRPLGVRKTSPIDGNFEALCSAFEYYNCNRETGKRIAFYI